MTNNHYTSNVCMTCNLVIDYYRHIKMKYTELRHDISDKKFVKIILQNDPQIHLIVGLDRQTQKKMYETIKKSI